MGKFMRKRKSYRKRKKIESKKSKYDLSKNLSNKYIVNYFIKTMNLGKHSKCYGTILIGLSTILFLIPIFNDEFLNKYKWIVLVAAMIVLLLSIINNSSSSWDKHDYDKIYKSFIENNRNEKAKRILDNEQILNNLMKYLKKGDKFITSASIGLLGMYFQIYNLYSKLGYFTDECNKFIYILLMLVIFVLGFALLCESIEKLTLLGIFQHVKNTGKLGYDVNKTYNHDRNRNVAKAMDDRFEDLWNGI